MNTAGHQVIAGPFGGALNQDWGLYFNKPPGIEKITDEFHHPVTEEQVLLHSGPAEVKIAVTEAQALLYFNVLIYIEWGRF